MDPNFVVELACCAETILPFLHSIYTILTQAWYGYYALTNFSILQ